MSIHRGFCICRFLDMLSAYYSVGNRFGTGLNVPVIQFVACLENECCEFPPASNGDATNRDFPKVAEGKWGWGGVCVKYIYIYFVV